MGDGLARGEGAVPRRPAPGEHLHCFVEALGPCGCLSCRGPTTDSVFAHDVRSQLAWGLFVLGASLVATAAPRAGDGDSFNPALGIEATPQVTITVMMVTHGGCKIPVTFSPSA